MPLDKKSSRLDKEIQPFLALAERGDAQAQFEIAHRFEKTRQSAERSNEAFAWMQKAAEQGHAQAQFHLSEMYGSGYAKNIKFEELGHYQQVWLQRAAENGFVQAQASMGLHLIRTQNSITAIEWLTKAAKQKHVNSAIELAKLYSLGELVVRDFRKALYWYRIAAANGYATDSVEQMIVQGGVSPSNSGGLKWFQISAEHGNIKAQLYLAQQFFYGPDVPIDAEKAAYWWGKAAAAGSNDAQYNLASLYLHGNGVEQNSAKAIQMFAYLADVAHEESMYVLGFIYSDGSFVVKDVEESVKWFRRGAKLGHLDSQFQLAQRLEHGDGPIKDWDEAMLWYKKAATQGHENAQKRLDKKPLWKL